MNLTTRLFIFTPALTSQQNKVALRQLVKLWLIIVKPTSVILPFNSATIFIPTVLMLTMAGYAAYRMTQRAAPAVADTEAYAMVAPSSSPMAVTFAQEYAIETALDEEENAADEEDG